MERAEVVNKLQELASEFRVENGGSLEHVSVSLALVLFSFCEALELTPGEFRQVLAQDIGWIYEELLIG